MDQVAVRTNVLQANQETAMRNRELFERERITAINLMSAPGAGKTTLLEATIQALRSQYRMAVIEGDLQTELDAERIRAMGIPSHQITTGTVCHLDARMIDRALAAFPVKDVELLFIENVGNLICPASYDLGEKLRVVVCSVAEGADKPKKYPVMFHKADAIVINKSDLALPGGAEIEELRRNVREVNSKASLFAVSCRTAAGLESWFEWLRQAIVARKAVGAAGNQG